MSGSSFIKTWLDELELLLRQEAKLAGLIGHAASIGTAREFFVKRILESFLPPGIHVGQGRILHGDGSLSKQIDVIIYDSRVPRLQVVPGSSLYLREGVIATVEVKSQLDASSYFDAMNNCASVPGEGTDVREETLQHAVDTFGSRHATSAFDARTIVGKTIAPASFIFSLNGALSPLRGVECTDTLVKQRQRGFEKWDPTWPRMIVAGDVIGISADRWTVPSLNQHDLNRLRDVHPGELTPVCGWWRTQHPFGAFACRLLYIVCDRFGATHCASGVTYAINNYIPLREYIDEMANNEFAMLWYFIDRELNSIAHTAVTHGRKGCTSISPSKTDEVL